MKIREPFHVLSPNKNGMGSSYICAKGDMCRTKGFEFWNDSKLLPDSVARDTSADKTTRRRASWRSSAFPQGQGQRPHSSRLSNFFHGRKSRHH
jgi:hypothetical protein